MARGLCARALLAAFALIAFSVAARAATPDNPGIASEIRQAASGKLKDFYRTRGYWPLWVRAGTIGPEAERLVGLLKTADLDGLDPDDYDADELSAVVSTARSGDPKALVEAELKLSRTFAAYVRDVRRPSSVRMTYLDPELVPKRPSELSVLRSASVVPSLKEYLETAGWMNPLYNSLRAGLADHQRRWSKLPAIGVPAGPTLRIGSKGERVRALRRRLGLPDSDRFDGALARRLREFQAAHGLPADGIAGATTLAAVNRDPAQYEGLIRLNLERARVLPNARTRHVVVDAASARLWMYEDGQAKGSMRVVVGMPDQPTPMLAGMMRYAVLNPYWNVPVDLVRRRVAQKVLEGNSLRGMGFEALSDWTASARVLDQREVDWAAVVAGTRELRVRQLPGKANAMGRMKFMFPNDLGIFLHDTPEKGLFGQQQRRFSSGCVRLEDAPRLATWLFGRPLKAKSSAPEQQVFLPAGVPVYLSYLTATPVKGGLAFPEDVYRRDAPLLKRFTS